MLADIIGCVVAAAVFAALGILLINGKCLTLYTAYFAATPEQRKAYDKRALGRFGAGLMLFFAACMVLAMVGVILEVGWMSTVVIVLVIVGGLTAFVYANTGNRFKVK